MMIFNDDIAESLVIAGFDIASPIQIPSLAIKKGALQGSFFGIHDLNYKN